MTRPERTTDPGPGPQKEEGPTEELLEEQIVDLPAREALSIVDPGIFGVRVPVSPGRPAVPPDVTDGAEPTPPET